jgi:murein DD-endopeptidase MepM/ murein hydrolase activator NlpD
MKLSNPIPNGKMSNSMLSKTVEISSYNSDTIFSPAQGTVVSSDKFKCGGNIKIEHYIDGNTYYSNFCNVNRLMSFTGNQVRQGEIIGSVGDSPIEYSVTDKSGSKLDVSKFLSGGFEPAKSKETTKEKKKEETKTNYEFKKDIPNPFMDALLSPFSLLSKAFKKESIIMNDNLVKEDINKIKKLIK